MVLDRKTWLNIVLGVMACIVLYWVLHETERVIAVLNSALAMMSPFLVGCALAFILNVPMRAFEDGLEGIGKSGLRRLLAIVLTIVVFVLILTAVFLLLIPQIQQTIDSLIPQIIGFAGETGMWINQILEDHPQIMNLITESTGLSDIDWASLADKALAVIGESLSAILPGALSAIGSLTTAVVNFVIAAVFAVYCLFRKETLARQGRKFLYAFLPEHWSDKIIRVLRLTNSTFSNFLSGQCLEVCILGTLFAVTMWIFRMPHIPLISVLVAVTAFIPMVGAFVGCFLGAFFILVDDPLLAIGFVIMFIVLQQIENNMIYPRVVGSSIGMPGMWVLLAVVVGGELLGVAGMFLMIPMTSVIYTLLGEFTNARLSRMNIDPEKLKPQPPELQAPFSSTKEENMETAPAVETTE